MLPWGHLEYSIAERQIELQEYMKQQRLSKSIGSARKRSRLMRFLQAALSVLRLPVDVLRNAHEVQREQAVSGKKHSTGVCETQMS